MDKRVLAEGLLAFGLKDKEARVYLALLELGESTAYVVSKKSGIKRPTTYLLLEQLQARGVVLHVPGSRRKTFVAKDPDELFSQAERALKKSEAILPALQALRRTESEKIQVMYFEGFDGVTEAMRYGMDKMEGKPMVAFWADVSEETDRRFGYFKEWHELFRLYKIPLRAFIPEGEIHHKYRKFDAPLRRTMQIMPRDIYCPFTFFDIGDTFTRIFDPTHMQAIVIENPSVAHGLKQIFELAWRAGYGKITRGEAG